MKKERIKKLCKALGKKLHIAKEEPLSSIMIVGDELYINGKPIDKTDLKDLVMLYRIRGLM